MSSQPKVQVRVTHRFEATAERVFDACLDPQLIAERTQSGWSRMLDLPATTLDRA